VIPATHSLADVATTLGKSRWWLAGQVREGKVPHLRVGRTVRFTDAHVAKILAEFEQTPAAHQVLAGLTRRSAAHRRRSA
jgi:hypothetical protein